MVIPLKFGFVLVFKIDPLHEIVIVHSGYLIPKIGEPTIAPVLAAKLIKVVGLRNRGARAGLLVQKRRRQLKVPPV